MCLFLSLTQIATQISKSGVCAHVCMCACGWIAISGWHFANQPPPASGQAEKNCLWPFCSRKSHAMIQPSLLLRCQPICGMVTVWIRAIAALTPTRWVWKCAFWTTSKCDYQGFSFEGEFISCAPNVIMKTHFQKLHSWKLKWSKECETMPWSTRSVLLKLQVYFSLVWLSEYKQNRTE